MKLNKCFIAIPILGCILYSANLLADPSRGVKWLMNEPVTLFEQGMKRLDEHAQILSTDREADSPREPGSQKAQVKQRSAVTKYFYEQNKIQVTVEDELWDGYVPDADACQKEVVSFVKYFFLGESIIDEDLSHRQRTQKQQLVNMVERWFRHDDFTRSNQPKGIYEEIAGLMELEVYLTRPEDRLPSVSCVTPLTGGPVTVIIRK